jgi:hypothetical protein
MEILLLVGIFAFVIAILYRSNRALDRVEVVEKELGVLEDEVKEVREHEKEAHAKINRTTSPEIKPGEISL